MKESFEKDLAAVARIDAVEKILEVVCRTTGLGFSAVARVTEDRWIACAVRDEIAFGLVPGGELSVGTTICDEIRRHGRAVVIDEVASDPAFCGHPTPNLYGFQSYISVPIRLRDGTFFGTLCAIDPRPAKLKSPAVVNMFTLFADLIAAHLADQEKLAASEAALSAERDAAQLREQFIAVLGHDLRNPLNAIGSAAEVLRRMPQAEGAGEMLAMIKRGVARMAGLIDDVLDFARGRLGEGLGVHREPDPKLAGHLEQVVAELRSAWPKRRIDLELSLTRPVPCDGRRIGQMLSNLIANALAHGDPASPIGVRAVTTAAAFEMAVTNHGETIPPAVVERLFQPFVRGQVKPRQEGLGLGLYIASEIARAHGGTLGVDSCDGTTCFTFRMPVPAVRAMPTPGESGGRDASQWRS